MLPSSGGIADDDGVSSAGLVSKFSCRIKEDPSESVPKGILPHCKKALIRGLMAESGSLKEGEARVFKNSNDLSSIG